MTQIIIKKGAFAKMHPFRIQKNNEDWTTFLWFSISSGFLAGQLSYGMSDVELGF